VFGSYALLLVSSVSSSFLLNFFSAFQFLSFLIGAFAFLFNLIGSIGKQWVFLMSLVFGASFGEFLKHKTLIQFY